MADRPARPQPLESEKTLRLFIEGVREYALLMLDATGHVVSWNEGAQHIKGYTADEIIGRHFSCFYPPEDIARGKPDFELRVATETGRFEDTGLRVRKDGSTFWANVVITAIFDDHRQLLGFGKVTRDISERIKAAEELKASEARLKSLVDTILDTVVDGLITINKAGEIQFYNAACERLFGYRRDEVVGKNVKLLMPAPFHDEHDGYLDSYRRTGERKIIGIGREVVGLRKDGSTFPMDLSVGEAKQEGESIFVGVIHDLTERRRTELQLAQSQKMEAVGQLTGGMAHDFNNLLTVMIGSLDLVVDQVPGNLRPLTQSALKAAERGAALVGQLLAFSRRQTLTPGTLGLNDLATGMEELLRRTLGEDIEIEMKLFGGLWPARADRGQVENALLNLAINARDAMPEGGKLTIETGNTHLDEDYAAHNTEVTPGDYVMLAVTDTGTGMPPDVVARAFEPFFTTKGVGKGTGLGLSMIYGFAKQSSGHLKVYSEVGHGTTVRLYLPRELEPATAVAAATAQAGHLRGGETILVVEDDPLVRNLVTQQLRDLGYRVVETTDGPEARRVLDSDAQIDLLFTDVVMPGGITGRQLAESARERRPNLKTLYTSGYTENSIIHQGKLDAGVHFLPKPFRRQQLAAKIREVLDA